MKDSELREAILSCSRDGRHIEAGWLGMASSAPPSVSDDEVADMRWMFFAGAARMFNVFAILADKTTSALAGKALVKQIENELREFIAINVDTEGTA